MNAEEHAPVPCPSSAGYWNAVVLFWGSLTSLVFFNLLPSFRSHERGWNLWVNVTKSFWDPKLLGKTVELITIASLLTLLVLVVASPFLVQVYFRSRVAWWLVTLMSVISTCAIWFIVFDMVSLRRIGLGGWCLLAAPALNLAGLLSLGSAKGSGRSGRRP